MHALHVTTVHKYPKCQNSSRPIPILFAANAAVTHTRSSLKALRHSRIRLMLQIPLFFYCMLPECRRPDTWTYILRSGNGKQGAMICVSCRTAGTSGSRQLCDYSPRRKIFCKHILERCSQVPGNLLHCSPNHTSGERTFRFPPFFLSVLGCISYCPLSSPKS